jgi:inorganic pyrophosphatase
MQINGWDKKKDGDPLAICVLTERLRDYFMTYKLRPGEASTVSITKECSKDYALKVVEASITDYLEKYGD